MIGSGEIIDAHGGYRDLKSYQNAEIVYDATTAFCDRFIEQRFLQEGGFTEKLYNARQQARKRPQG